MKDSFASAAANPVQYAQRVVTIGAGGKEMQEDFDESDLNRFYFCIQTTLEARVEDLSDEERDELERLRDRVGSQLNGCLV